MQTEPAAEDFAILDRRRRVTRLYLRGRSQRWIAARVGVSQPTVFRDLEAIRKEWLAAAVFDMNAAKVQELAKLDELELTYWRAWERSIGTHTKKTETVGKDGGLELSETSEELVGDPRFLAGVMTCVERRCKILGLDAPKQINGTIQVPVKVVAGINMEMV